MVTPYEILGITPNATPDEIKRAYRKRSKKTHPDKGGSPDDFKAVQTAYETLIDPEARRCMDAGIPAPSNMYQDARDYLVGLYFERIVGDDALFSDIFAHINRRISLETQHEKDRQGKIEARRALYEKCVDRVTCAEPPCMFTGPTARKIAELDIALGQAARRLSMLALAARMLQAYTLEPLSPLESKAAAEHYKRKVGGR